MNDKQLDSITDEILDCFTCDEEMMSEEGVLRRRVREVLGDKSPEIKTIETCEDLFSWEFSPKQKSKVANELLMFDLDFDRYCISEYPKHDVDIHGEKSTDDFILYYTGKSERELERAYCDFEVFKTFTKETIPEFYYYIHFDESTLTCMLKQISKEHLDDISDEKWFGYQTTLQPSHISRIKISEVFYLQINLVVLIY